MFTFTPKGSGEPMKKNLLEGYYWATIIDAEGKTSKAGNPMIGLDLEIEYDGGEYKVFDNLVYTENTLYKLTNFARAVGKNTDSDQISLDPDELIGRRVIVKTYKERDKDEFDKIYNRIGTYLLESDVSQMGPLEVQSEPRIPKNATYNQGASAGRPGGRNMGYSNPYNRPGQAPAPDMEDDDIPF